MKARLLFALFSATAFAETDYNDAVKSFNNYPSKITEEVQWNVPYDETYLPYNVCENVGLHLTGVPSTKPSAELRRLFPKEM
ncbi:MAG: hypothetical protein ACI38O_04665 [Fibrobacter intestinalis]|uniref:hypothetical protein n=1 Tax=Fibrobacter intestinalis TaxID=28122 RepID=UPI003EFDA2D3